MHPTAVLFDFDGVLVDSMPSHVEAWSSASRQLFGSELTSEERNAIVGKSTRVIANMISSWRGEQRANELMEIKKRELMVHVKEVEVFPGVYEMMSYLGAESIPFGVASNAPREYVQATVAALEFPVKVVLGCEDVQNPKPAPDLYLLCAKRLGISPADHGLMVVFEDSTHGIEAAVKAGAVAYGITSHQTPQALIQAGASQTFAGFTDFLTSGFQRRS